MLKTVFYDSYTSKLLGFLTTSIIGEAKLARIYMCVIDKRTRLFLALHRTSLLSRRFIFTIDWTQTISFAVSPCAILHAAIATCLRSRIFHKVTQTCQQFWGQTFVT